jgi:LPXTG-motif cell wall-anchored protein
VDETGAVLQGLAAAGRARSPAARRAVRWLRSVQNDDGGFGQAQGHDSNAQSAAWAVQGILAARAAPATFRRATRTPLAYLASLQQPDGSFRYSRTSAQTPVWVTGQVVAALRRKTFPLDPPARRHRRAGSSRGAARRDLAPRAAAPARRKRARVRGGSAEAREAPVPLRRVAARPPDTAPAAGEPGDTGSQRSLVAAIAGGALVAAAGAIAWRRRRRA